MTGRARLAGLGALARRLDPQAALNGTLVEAGEEVARQARTGLAGEDADEALVESLKTARTASGLEIGSEHPGAHAAEFGTLIRPARPFLQPAFEAVLGPLKTQLRRALKTHLRDPKRRAP